LKAEPLGALLDFAVEAAWLAGRITLRWFQAGVAAERKPDGSPVTPADREAEAFLRERIERFHPRDGLLGEEFGARRPRARRRWILDPIDGTASFLHGVPLYGVLIGLEIDAEPAAGVIHFPALGETVCAARGLGCRWNGRPARVSAVDRLEEGTVLWTSAAAGADGAAAIARLSGLAGLTRGWGDCYGHALVATGRAEAMIDPRMKIWDCAALAPVIEEAGGVFTDWEGRRTIRGESAISTNAALAAAVRRSLASPRTAGAPRGTGRSAGGRRTDGEPPARARKVQRTSA